MLKKPEFIYTFDDQEYSEKEQILLITRLAMLLLEIDEETKAA